MLVFGRDWLTGIKVMHDHDHAWPRMHVNKGINNPFFIKQCTFDFFISWAKTYKSLCSRYRKNYIALNTGRSPCTWTKKTQPEFRPGDMYRRVAHACQLPNKKEKNKESRVLDGHATEWFPSQAVKQEN